MSVRLEAMAFEVPNPAAVAVFWAGLLGREPVPEPSSTLVPGDDRQLGLRFITTTSTGPGRNRLHLHLTSDSPGHQQHLLAHALRLGGSHLDVGQRPGEGHVVLADPGGNEFCIIEPGERWLAGCGPLGEVTCDGPPTVGRFWRDALGWPLVWEQGDQTAVQSPLGGTKVSWDIWPRQQYAVRRQTLDLLASDLGPEVERLLGLGATLLREREGHVELAAPDGSVFRVGQG